MISAKIAAAGGAARAMLARKGFVVGIWTGYTRECEEACCRECPPKLYPTKESALGFIRRAPSWGRAAANVYVATVIPHGDGDRPDYVIGGVVANGLEA